MMLLDWFYIGLQIGAGAILFACGMLVPFATLMWAWTRLKKWHHGRRR